QRGGGFAGTAQDLQGVIDRLSDIEGITLSNATNAVTSLAKSGKLAGDSLRLAAEASAYWASVTGDGADEVAKKFNDLAGDPLNALVSLNAAEHFLTEAQYERIRALIEEGKEQEAAEEAVRIYAGSVRSAAENAAIHMGAMRRLWNELKEDVTEVWHEVQGFANFLAHTTERFRDRSLAQRF